MHIRKMTVKRAEACDWSVTDLANAIAEFFMNTTEIFGFSFKAAEE